MQKSVISSSEDFTQITNMVGKKDLIWFDNSPKLLKQLQCFLGSNVDNCLRVQLFIIISFIQHFTYESKEICIKINIY